MSRDQRRTAIVNGRIVAAGGVVAGGLLMAGDRIVALGPQVAAMEHDVRVDAGGHLVAPGLIDFGVFAIDKPAFHFGGITRAALMPDQSPPIDLPSRVAHLAKSAKPDLWVHPFAGATRDLNGESLAEIALMRDAGARGVATGRRWIGDSGVMLRLLQYAAMLDLPLVVHSEDFGLAAGAVATAGEMATRLGLPAAPPEAEALAIARDCALARIAGARVHFRQVTTRGGLDLVRRAKAEGLPMTAGVTPAHFMLSDLALADFRSFMRLSPPLRSEDDRQAVREAIADGTIDVIASGHDPRGPEDKRLPFADAEPGMAGAESLLAMTLGLVRDGLVDLPRAFDLVAGAPGRLLGVAAGELREGSEADVVVVDPERPWVIDSRLMAATAGNTPFHGLPTQGRPIRVYKGGVEVSG